MISSITDSIREQNARFARETEYIKEISRDDIIDERTDIAMEEVQGVTDSVEELEEAVSLYDQMPETEDLTVEAAEIQRILDADGDISFNEMVGIKE